MLYLDKQILNNKRHIHFIGVGGSGMYPLAQILHGQGYYITGSDNNETETLQAVRKMGIPVFLGQRAENINGADIIIHTAAIMEDNPELIAAKLSGVPVLERSELLGIITESYDNAVCISGTHGKTTVTSMITQILAEQGLDISAVIGGKLPLIGGSGLSGKSDIMICEACEFGDHFLNLHPDICVILNIDADHLDYFGSLENIICSFSKFALNASKAVIFNGDDVNSLQAVKNLPDKTEIVTFGMTDKNNWYPQDICYKSGMKTEYSLMHNGEKLCRITLNVPGEHNILNSVASAASAFYVGATAEGIAKGLEDFKGAGRRFEKYGEVNGITVVDDYAHHPAEIKVALNAAMKLGFKRVWAVHQPFTYSRTAMLADDFADALSIADKVVLTSIMGSREKNTYGIYTKDLGAKINGCKWFDEEDHDKNFELVCGYICENVEEGDLVITLGCGDVNKVARMILKKLTETKG